jgi:polyisoprenoid-binding protein YceI
MKKTNLMLVMLVASVLIVSCGGGSGEKSTTETKETPATETQSVAASTFTVNPDQTVVKWKGEVRGVYGHYGLIDVKEGSIEAAGNKITGGEIVIDMTTIQPTDSASYDEENTAAKLVGHLSTGDFFLVEEYPTASFKIKSHTNNQLIGDLTIRGITNEETVNLSSLNVNENGVEGEGELILERQKYDVKWEHYVKDYVLNDTITMNISLVASK